MRGAVLERGAHDVEHRQRQIVRVIHNLSLDPRINVCHCELLQRGKRMGWLLAIGAIAWLIYELLWGVDGAPYKRRKR